MIGQRLPGLKSLHSCSEIQCHPLCLVSLTQAAAGKMVWEFFGELKYHLGTAVYWVYPVTWRTQLTILWILSAEWCAMSQSFNLEHLNLIEFPATRFQSVRGSLPPDKPIVNQNWTRCTGWSSQWLFFYSILIICRCEIRQCSLFLTIYDMLH